MPDAPLATLGAPMRIRHRDGSRLACPGFSLPGDPRHETMLAGMITSDDRLHYLGPDEFVLEAAEHAEGSAWA